MTSSTLLIQEKNGVTYIQFPRLKQCGVVRHVFSTRLGGVSEGIYSSMNLSFSLGDRRESVLKNYELLCACDGIDPSHLVLSRQTHTANVVSVTQEDIGRGIAREPYSDVDGLVTNIPGIALVTHYADCTPLLFCDPVKRVIATSHSGWRGTVQQIGKVTVRKMEAEFGCRPEDILAGVGPCIGSCCYEVDEPVYNAFAALPNVNLSQIFTPKGYGKFMLDLAKANQQILIGAGVRPEHIDVSDLCTCCHHTELHSHRATGGRRGVLAAIIELI